MNTDSNTTNPVPTQSQKIQQPEKIVNLNEDLQGHEHDQASFEKVSRVQQNQIKDLQSKK